MELKQQIVANALTPRRDAVKSTDYLIEQTERWAADRQILTHSDAKAQALKLVSEVGELADAIIKNDEAGVIDGIGDCTVVLVILAKMTGLTLPMCLAAAYEEIKDRKGRMVPGGAFVKEQA
jgi:NTP pyrophosphatase (non-canonical NTP hydrolase)